MKQILEALDSNYSRNTISKEFRVHTSHGAILSIIGVIVIIYLTVSELYYNIIETSIVEKVHVNATTPTGLEIFFDITFPQIPCALVSIDANDPTGQQQSLHLDRKHHIYKHRVDKNGKRIGHAKKTQQGGTLKHDDLKDAVAEDQLKKDNENTEKEQRALNDMKINNPENNNNNSNDNKMNRERRPIYDDDDDNYYDDDEVIKQRHMIHGKSAAAKSEVCDCYGAGEVGECCATCDDVKRAYTRKGWTLTDPAKIIQCQNVLTSKDEKDEGCNIKGNVALSTGGGNLHFAPSRELEDFGSNGINSKQGFSILDIFFRSFEQFNVSHTINKVRFNTDGKEFPGHVHQLDDEIRVIDDAYGMHQYYFQIVPTVYKYLDGREIRTNQYSVTEHVRHVNPGSGQGLPGVFFFYEVSALHVDIYEYRRGYIHFFTSICAIVGGVITVLGMIDSYVYTKIGGSKNLNAQLLR